MASFQTGYFAAPAILDHRATAAVAFDDLMAQGALAGLAVILAVLWLWQRPGRRVGAGVARAGLPAVGVAGQPEAIAEGDPDRIEHENHDQSRDCHSIGGRH